MAADVVALITAGGGGTRLMPHTRHLPKPLFPMGNRHLVDYAAASVEFADRRYISLRSDQHDLLDYLQGHWPALEVVVEDQPLGTAGSLLESGNPVLSNVRRGTFLLTLPADHVTEDLDLSAVVAQHMAAEPDTSQAVLAKTVNYGDYVWLDGEQTVVRVATSRSDDAYSTTGIFVFSPDYLLNRLQHLQDSRAQPAQVDLYRDLYLDAVRRGRARGIPTHASYWDDAGTALRYWTNAMRLSAGRNVFSGRPRLDPSPDIERCVVLGSGDLRGVRVHDSIISWTADDRMVVTSVS